MAQHNIVIATNIECVCCCAAPLTIVLLAPGLNAGPDDARCEHANTYCVDLATLAADCFVAELTVAAAGHNGGAARPPNVESSV